MSSKRYMYLIGALGFGLLLLWIYNLEFDKILNTKYIIFLLLMTLSQIQTLNENDSHFGIEFSFVYSSVFIFGAGPAALMKALSTAICQIYFKIKCGYKYVAEGIIFKIGQNMISFSAAIGFYLYFNKRYSWGYPFEIILQSAAIVLYFLLNNLMMQYYLVIKYRKPFYENFFELLKLDFYTYLMSVPFGLTAVIMYRSNGFPQTLLVLSLYLAVVYIYILYLNAKNTNRELAALYDMSVAITSTLDVEKVMDMVLDSIENIAPWDSACLYVYQNGWLVPAIYEGNFDEDFNKSKLKPGEEVCGFCLFERGEIINNYHKYPKLKELSICPPDTKSLIAVPFMINKELIGGILLTSNKNNIYNKKHLTLLCILASQAAVALKNAQLFSQTTQMAISDGLTGLYNHSYLYSELERQMKYVKKKGGYFSLIMIDVDYFKRYNDMYGHIIGDTILKNLAGILKKNVRDKDIIGRYGGEEFAIILPGIKACDAVKIAERIREVIENTPLARVGNKKIYITISAGIASYPTDAETVEELVNKADKAMIFGAKQKGRNKVVMFCPNMNKEN